MNSSGCLTPVAENTQPVYLRDENGGWGQPPASQYVLSVEDGVMYGSMLGMLTSSSDMSTNRLSSSVYSLEERLEVGPCAAQEPWENLSDEELLALYAEVIDEDRDLAQLGLAHYAEILRQEEASE